MSQEALLLATYQDAQVQELHPPDEHVPPPATPEQVRAADAVFAQQQKESSTVAGLLSLYTGAVMLQNMACDAMHRPEESKEKPRLQTDEDGEDE
jgi:hypothetical protein